MTVDVLCVCSGGCGDRACWFEWRECCCRWITLSLSSSLQRTHVKQDSTATAAAPTGFVSFININSCDMWHCDTMSQCHCDIVTQCHSVSLCHSDIVTLWHSDTMTLWHRDTVTLWHYDIMDIMTLWHYDPVTSWQCDIMTSWHCDTVTLWHSDIMDIMTRWHIDTVTFWCCDIVTVSVERVAAATSSHQWHHHWWRHHQCTDTWHCTTLESFTQRAVTPCHLVMILYCWRAKILAIFVGPVKQRE